MLNEHWLVNVDLKKLFLNTDVNINNGAIKADVDINPWIVGVGMGYRF
jgi:outer membrane protein